MLFNYLSFLPKNQDWRKLTMLFNKKKTSKKGNLNIEINNYIKFCKKYYYIINDYESLKAYYKLKDQIIL